MRKDLYKIIRSPYLTEKVSALTSESNQYAFKVDRSASKLDIKNAVEEYFSVKVKEVNTIKVKGKTKRLRNTKRKKSDWKKAYVRLEEGQTIDIGTE